MWFYKTKKTHTHNKDKSYKILFYPIYRWTNNEHDKYNNIKFIKLFNINYFNIIYIKFNIFIEIKKRERLEKKKPNVHLQCGCFISYLKLSNLT